MSHTCQTGLAYCLCRGALILESVLPPRTDEERAMQRCLMDLLIMSDVIEPISARLDQQIVAGLPRKT